MNKNDLLVDIKRLSKSFPGVQALSNVNFQLRKGEIHGLLGENGAGKSTLIKVLTGLYPKDSGSIELEGNPLDIGSPQDAPKHGISTVYQEINLIPTLSVAENIHIGREPKRFGRIDWKKINDNAKKAIKKLDLDIDVTQPVESYSIAIQQLVAITRALEISAKVLILDEPTSSLDSTEVEHLFSVMKKLKQEGIGIIFVTHFLDQVYEITDSITVLRNGELVGTYETAKLPRIDLIAKMLGKELTEFSEDHKGKKRASNQTAEDDILYQIEGMARKGVVKPFDLTIKKGEVLGFAGLLGSGRTEIARLIFGVDKAETKQTKLKGKDVFINSPKKAIASSFAFCPENRKAEGIITDLSVRENIILAQQARKGIFKLISKKQQNDIVNKYIKALNIKTPSAEQAIDNLSGGNQQKAIVGRWMATDPDLLILDEPTRGIDVGAKAEIQKLIESLAEQGLSILFISSELEEVINCSRRVVVLRDRKKMAELEGRQIDEKSIMHIIANEEENENECKNQPI